MTFEKKNAPAGVGTPARAESFSRGASCSLDNFITAEQRGQWQVAAALGIGAESALPSRELRLRLGGINERQLTKRVELDRKSGAPICATVHGTARGYYLAATPAELEGYIQSLSRRIASVCITRAALRRTLIRWRETEGEELC